MQNSVNDALLSAQLKPRVRTKVGEVGVKHDDGKPPISLIPRRAIEEEARVFGFGADKYGKGNWRGGLLYSRLIDAALRHVLAFADGENNDPESGLPHTAHARACLAMLMQIDESWDDRK